MDLYDVGIRFSCRTLIIVAELLQEEEAEAKVEAEKN